MAGGSPFFGRGRGILAGVEPFFAGCLVAWGASIVPSKGPWEEKMRLNGCQAFLNWLQWLCFQEPFKGDGSLCLDQGFGCLLLLPGPFSRRWLSGPSHFWKNCAKCGAILFIQLNLASLGELFCKGNYSFFQKLRQARVYASF